MKEKEKEKKEKKKKKNHDGDFTSGPGVVGVTSQVLGGHNIVGTSISLPSNDSDLILFLLVDLK